jgi:restriction endonuclease Mrr
MVRSPSTTGKKIALPSHTEIKKPLLQLLKAKGEVSLEEAVAHIAKTFSVSERSQHRKQGSGRETVLQNRVRWARWELKRDGVIVTTRRGCFTLAA